jgi:hypothetical protein
MTKMFLALTENSSPTIGLFAKAAVRIMIAGNGGAQGDMTPLTAMTAVN